MKRAGFPRVRELVCVGVGVSVENAPDRIIAGDVWMKALIVVANLREGSTGPGGRGWGRGRVTTPVGGIAGRGGAVLTLCDRSQREALIGESLLSSAREVGRGATVDCTVGSWVVTVSSCLVMDASAFSDEHMNGMRMDSPSDRSLTRISSGLGISFGEKRSQSRVS